MDELVHPGYTPILGIPSGPYHKRGQVSYIGNAGKKAILSTAFQVTTWRPGEISRDSLRCRRVEQCLPKSVNDRFETQRKIQCQLRMCQRFITVTWCEVAPAKHVVEQRSMFGGWTVKLIAIWFSQPESCGRSWMNGQSRTALTKKSVEVLRYGWAAFSFSSSYVSWCHVAGLWWKVKLTVA